MPTIQAQSELMKNQRAAQLMPPQSQLAALQESTGDGVLFSISDDGALMATVQTPGSPTEWQPVDLSSELSEPLGGATVTAQAFSVCQDPATGSITVALAVTVGSKTQPELYVMTGLSDDPSAAWLTAAGPRPWLARPYDDTAHARSSFTVSYVRAEIVPGAPAPLVLVGITTPPSSFVQNYLVNPSATVTSGVWTMFTTAENYDTMLATDLGRAARSLWAGLYELYELDAETSLTFTPATDYAPILKLTPPSGATALAASPAANGRGTDLYVAGEGSLYLYASAAQSNTAQGAAVVTASVLTNVQSLYAYVAAGQTVVWGLSGEGDVFRTQCPAGQESEASQWSVPVVLVSGAEQLASYTDATTGAHRLFAHLSDQQLVRLEQDPVTTLWRQTPVVLPPLATDDMVETYTYSTHIAISDDASMPMAGEPLTITPVTSCGAYVNGTYMHLAAGATMTVQADATGALSVVQETDSLAAVTFTVSHPAASTVTVNPMLAPLSTIGGVQSTSALTAITVTDEDGNTKPLVPSGASPEDLATTVQAFGQLAHVATQVPQDGSPQTGSSGPPTTRLAGAASDDIWDAIEVAAGDVLRWVTDEARSTSNVFCALGEDIWSCFVTIEETAYRFELRTAAAVMQAAQFLIARIGAAFEDLVKWLGFIFAWQDILRTHAALKNIVKQCLTQAADDLGSISDAIGVAFSDIDQLLKKWTGLDSVTGSVSTTAASSPQLPAQNAPQSHWGKQQLGANAGQATVTSGVAPQSSDDLTNLLTTLTKAVSSEEQTLSGAAGQLKTQVFDQAEQLTAGQMVERVSGILGEVLVGTVEDIIDTTISIAELIVSDVLALLDAPIDIPVIAPMYEEIAGAELSVLDLGCLVVAIPATINYKLVADAAPFPDDDFTASVIGAPDLKTLQELYQGASTQARAGDLASAAPIQTLAQVLHVVAFYGSACFIEASLFKRDAAGQPVARVAFVIHGVTFYLATAPAFALPIAASAQETWDLQMAQAIYSVTAMQKLIDVFGYLAGTPGPVGEAMTEWNAQTPWLDLALGAAGFVPAIAALTRQQDSRSVVSFLASVFWNVNRGLSPGASVPEVFAAKMVCVGLYGAMHAYLGSP